MAARVQSGEYDSVVQIVKGKFKGRVGYYDNDESDDKRRCLAVIYFGEPFVTGYVLVRLSYLRQATPDQDQRWRKKNISSNHLVNALAGLTAAKKETGPLAGFITPEALTNASWAPGSPASAATTPVERS